MRGVAKLRFASPFVRTQKKDEQLSLLVLIECGQRDSNGGSRRADT